MAKKLTITVSAEVYAALHQQVGPGRIAAFIERHVAPHLRLPDDLEGAYQAYAAWLDSAEGGAEAAELDDWLAGDLAPEPEPGEARWPDAWYDKMGPAER